MLLAKWRRYWGSVIIIQLWLEGQTVWDRGTMEDILKLILYGNLLLRQQTRTTLFQTMACRLSPPSHYLNQCWSIVNWTLKNKLYWIFNRNHNIYIQETAFKNAVCEMVAILSRPQCVNITFCGTQMATDDTVYSILSQSNIHWFYCATQGTQSWQPISKLQNKGGEVSTHTTTWQCIWTDTIYAATQKSCGLNNDQNETIPQWPSVTFGEIVRSDSFDMIIDPNIFH